MGQLAGRGTYPARGESNRGVKRYVGRFETDGANNPINKKGQGFSVVKTAATTGRFTVTLEGAVREILHINVELWDVTSGTTKAIVLSTGADPGDVRTGAVFFIETHSVDGTEANLDGPIVSFEAVCSLVE